MEESNRSRPVGIVNGPVEPKATTDSTLSGVSGKKAENNSSDNDVVMDVVKLDSDFSGDDMQRLSNSKAMNASNNSVHIVEQGAGESEEEEARQAIDMLRGDDIAGRVSAAYRLESVAAVLGEKRTREELLPFLTESVDDEDEVLVALAIALGKLIPFVGGAQFVHTILPPLEYLLSVEESTVREKAAESTKMVSEVLPDDTFQDQYAEMISRLAVKEWFTARMSACNLIALSFARLSLDRKEVQLRQFASLCRDDAPMVRRVASQYLGILLMKVVESEGASSVAADGMATVTLLPLYEELAANEQDSVRLQTTKNCIAVGKALSDLKIASSSRNENVENSLTQANGAILVKRVLPLVVATIDDRSWRVRWTAASKFAEVVKAFANIPGAVDSLIQAYEKLLQDPEAEVRTAATLNLSEVAKCGALVRPAPPVAGSTDAMDESSDEPENQKKLITIAERLVRCITSLTEDESEHVRAALAMVATELAPVLGKDATISHLVPPILLLLRDSASEVRLNLISSLSSLNQVIGVDLLSQSLLPAILDLAEDNKWRIRLAIIQHIPLLAKQLGKDFFSDQLSSLCVGWLNDKISSIRQAGATNLMVSIL